MRPRTGTPRTVLGGLVPGVLVPGAAARILCVVRSREAGSLYDLACPQWLQHVSDYLPTQAYAALGQAIELGGAPHTKDVALLAAYLVLFAGAAAWLYRKDTRKA